MDRAGHLAAAYKAFSGNLNQSACCEEDGYCTRKRLCSCSDDKTIQHVVGLVGVAYLLCVKNEMVKVFFHS